MNTLTLYPVQMDISWQEDEANYAKVESLLAQELPCEGGLIVLPEMFSSGFSQEVEKVAENSQDGKTLAKMKGWATRYGCAILGGWAEEAGDGRMKNVASFISPEGQEIARYSKQRAFSYSGEDKVVEEGDRCVLVDYEGWRIAPFICYDLRFPELYRRACVEGQAELLITIANWPSSRIEHFIHLGRSRAIENQAYSLIVNRVGKDLRTRYNGQSRIWCPEGSLISQLPNGEGLYRIEISKENLFKYREKFPVLKDARKFAQI